MIREDARSRCVAIVPDFVVNPGSALYEDITGKPGYVLDVLIEDGWGIMKPPPHILSEVSAAHAVATMAGDAVDYLRHKYTVVIVALDELPQGGVWLNLFEAAFRELAMSVPNVVRVAMTRDGAPAAAEFRTTLRASAARNDAEAKSRQH